MGLKHKLGVQMDLLQPFITPKARLPTGLQIYFLGNASCIGINKQQVAQNCYGRSFTEWGSSKNYQQTISLEDWTILSSQPGKNPLYFNWNKVFIPYCDGSFHQGYLADPISINGTDIYFRGTKNTIQHFQFLNRTFGLYDSKEVVVAGTSSGAISAHLWSNYLYDRLKYPQSMLLISDSGLFIFNLSTSSLTSLPTHQLNPCLIWSMLTLPYLLPNVLKSIQHKLNAFKAETPMNLQNQKYFCQYQNMIQYGLKSFVTVPCLINTQVQPANLSSCNSQEMTAIGIYRSMLLESIRNFTSISKNGVWAISCVQHGFLLNINDDFQSKDYEVPANYGYTIFEALVYFKLGARKQFIDKVDWPFNFGCNGLTNKSKLRKWA